jgi:hypothetical protein
MRAWQRTGAWQGMAPRQGEEHGVAGMERAGLTRGAAGLSFRRGMGRWSEMGRSLARDLCERGDVRCTVDVGVAVFGQG